LNEQLDLDSLVREIGLDGDELDWRKDFVNFGEDDRERLEASNPCSSSTPRRSASSSTRTSCSTTTPSRP